MIVHDSFHFSSSQDRMIYRRLDSWLFGSSEAGVGERAAIGDCGQVTLEAINASWPGGPTR